MGVVSLSCQNQSQGICFVKTFLVACYSEMVPPHTHSGKKQKNKPVWNPEKSCKHRPKVPRWSILQLGNMQLTPAHPQTDVQSVRCSSCVWCIQSYYPLSLSVGCSHYSTSGSSGSVYQSIRSRGSCSGSFSRPYHREQSRRNPFYSTIYDHTNGQSFVRV